MSTEYKCNLPDCEHVYSRIRPPAEHLVALHLAVSHNPDTLVRLVERNAEDEYVEEPLVQQLLTAARTVWESEQSNNESYDEHVASAHALMEFIIAFRGLPLHLSSFGTRERLYREILGYESVMDWMNAERPNG